MKIGTRLSRVIFLLALLAGYGAPAHAADVRLSWPAQIQQDLVRLASVEWRLNRHAKDLCARQRSTIGMVLDHIEAYDARDRDFVREQTGLKARPQVIFVLEGSPAAAAGLKAGDEIAAIQGRDVSGLATDKDDMAFLADLIVESLGDHPSGKPVSLEIIRDGHTLQMNVTPQASCNHRIILKTSEDMDAYSDEDNIAITSGMMRFLHNDNELALIAGHELAHVLRHKGKSASLFGQKKQETQADLVGAQLAHCAGYDVRASLDFWRRYAKRDVLGFLPGLTHPSTRKRLQQLEITAEGLSCPALPRS